MTHSEQSAAAELTRLEPDAVVIKMTATGNPDFIVIPKAAIGLVRFAEVKLKDDLVPEHQQEMHSRLRSHGFQVDVLRVGKDSLIPFIALPAKRRSKGDGGLFKVKGSPFWRAQYRQDGKTIRVNTKCKLKMEAIHVLRKLMYDAQLRRDCRN